MSAIARATGCQESTAIGGVGQTLRSNVRMALAVSALTLAAFVLTGPGRMDSIDGQFRFDVALNLVNRGVPELSDPFLLPNGVRGVDGRVYANYGPGPSYLAVPLVWLGDLLGDSQGELSRFLFTWQNSILGSAALAVLVLFYLELGVPRRSAVAWTLATGFASLFWIGATTVLEQGQHAFFAILGTFLAWLAARRRSTLLATGAGFAAGALMLYQAPFALHQPLIATAALRSATSPPMEGRKESLGRFFAFGLASITALLTLLLYNFNRFGVAMPNPAGNPGAHPPILGNPLIGVPALLLSPGKSVLLFSPIVLLCAVGLRRLSRREPALVFAVVSTSALQLGFVGSLSFFHGDWCWGPRYLIVLIPLLAIGLPFALDGASAAMRRFAVVVICLGVFSNVLGLSLVHERFFHEKGLAIYFWKDDPGFYWRESNYFHRFGEIARTLRDGMPPEATTFTNSPYPGLLTYVFTRGGPPQVDAPWMRRYRIFYRPRPWPLWLAAEKENWARGEGFPAFWWLVGGLVAAGAAGAGLTWSAIRESERAAPAADSG